MTTLANTHPTLLDLRARLGENDKIAMVIEALNQSNEIYDDLVMLPGTDLTGGPITTAGTITHANSAVTPGTYGDSANTVTLAINARGHITSAVAQLLAAAWGALTGIPAAIVNASSAMLTYSFLSCG